MASMRRRLRMFSPGLLLLAAVLGPLAAQLAAQQSKPVAAAPPVGEWQSLFDGKTLQGWRETPFSDRGTVSIKDGTLVLGTGYMTGITWTGWFPRSNFEVRFEAIRVQGGDFFAGVTFPVKDSYCSWINGGWGGDVVGLSSLDDHDASDNETTFRYEFQYGHWYAFRLRVTDDRIQAWIDDELAIDVAIVGYTISLRPGPIELCVPFGFATYSTTGALRKLEYRLLPPLAAGRKPSPDD